MARVGETVQIGGVTLALAPAARWEPELRLRVVSLDAAAQSFEAALKVSRPVRDADLIAIQVRASDPAQAAAAANLLAGHLIAGRQGVQRARTGSTVQYLKPQLDTIGGQLRRAENALRAYRERARVMDPTEEARVQVGRLAQIQAERAGLQAEAQALGQLLEQIRHDSPAAATGGAAPSRRLIAFPTLFRNEATAQLLEALAQVENERSALLVRRTPQDPDVQILSSRVHELDAQLQGIAETYLQGLTNQVAALEGRMSIASEGS